MISRPWLRFYDPGVPPALTVEPHTTPRCLAQPPAEFPDATAACVQPPRVATAQPRPRVHFFRKLLRQASPERPRTPPTPDDLAVLQFTGGTTARSKGAMLTHANLAANLQQTGAWFTGLKRGHEVMLAVLPLFHSFGMTAAMNFPVSWASAIVLIPDPRDVKAIVHGIAQHRVTLLPA